MEQEGGGDDGEDDRGVFFFNTDMQHGKAVIHAPGPGGRCDMGVQYGPSTVSFLAGCLSASFREMPRLTRIFFWVRGLLCCAVLCMQKACSEYSYPVPNSCMPMQTQREWLQKRRDEGEVDGMAFGIGVKLNLDICVACRHSIDPQCCQIPPGQPELLIYELFNKD